MTVARKIAAILLVPFLSLGVVACSSSTTESSTVSESSAEETKKNYPNNVIDIRDSSDFYEGHLDQSINLPYSDEMIFSNVISIMNPTLVYELYGNSEEEVEEVVKRLEASGFQNIKNLGDLENASKSTGLEIVK